MSDATAGSSEFSESMWIIEPQDSAYLGFLCFQAGRTVRALEAVWELPKDSGIPQERFAMWQSICLDDLCEAEVSDSIKTLADQAFPLPAGRDAATVRYDCEAAVRMVPHLLPFDAAERDWLQGGGMVFDSSADEVADTSPKLFDRWHQWLWEDVTTRPELSAEHGRASELVVAADRLHQNLGSVLMEDVLERLI